jgi:homocysteine S-methyltransferase
VDDEDGARLRSGEPVAEVVPVALAGGAAALLANCSAPEAMPAALAALAAAGLPYGAYANGFHEITKDFLKDSQTVDALRARGDLTPEGYAATALGWVEAGARIVGGCCEIGPAHIAALARALTAAGHRIV